MADPCTLWEGGRDGKGYAMTRVDGVRVRVHRVVCAEVHGPPPSPKHEVAHSCGNGRLGCVTPEHLRWATRRENAKDASRHGVLGAKRPRRGEKVNTAVLTADDVAAIRASGLDQYSLAERYGVTQPNISAIILRKTWKHVP